MTRRLANALLVTLLAAGLAGCQHLPEPLQPARAERLEEARAAMHGGSFARADRILSSLASDHAGRREGREALFLLGVLHLDPRNPGWDPAEAAKVLDVYLDSRAGERRPEAVALFALARRLGEPPAAAVLETGGEEAAIADGDDVEALRDRLADCEGEIARLREELERIRRTLSPPRR
jgi:hypothetical protein